MPLNSKTTYTICLDSISFPLSSLTLICNGFPFDVRTSLSCGCGAMNASLVDDDDLVNCILDRLESDWKVATEPLSLGGLASYLDGVDGPLRRDLIKHLLAVDLETRSGSAG